MGAELRRLLGMGPGGEHVVGALADLIAGIHTNLIAAVPVLGPQHPLFLPVDLYFHRFIPPSDPRRRSGRHLCSRLYRNGAGMAAGGFHHIFSCCFPAP